KSFSRDFSDLPMVACFALFWRYVRRAAGGTQKILSARYSSGSSGSAPFSFVSSACFSSNESEMYFKKMRPRTTCLYSAASMLLRNLSAASHSLASKPTLAELPLEDSLAFARGIGEKTKRGEGKKKVEGLVVEQLREER